VFGASVAHVYAIEFQKRGLPHMHILIFLASQYKLRTPADIDSSIQAYWPDPLTQPTLFNTIKHCMVHGPCGIANPRSPCMEKGHCTKGYLKPFSSSTQLDNHGYPHYYRPNDGRAYDVGGFLIDNRWIVPYSPYFPARYLLCTTTNTLINLLLLYRYDCHINVECAASLGAFKYAVTLSATGPQCHYL
jgi:hypothetical protein